MSDNYIEGDGAKAIATVLKENMFIVNLVRLRCYKSVVDVYIFTFRVIFFVSSIRQKSETPKRVASHRIASYRRRIDGARAL